MIVLSQCDWGPGGAQSIVVRVSEELASRGIPCIVLDTPWGFVWKTLKKKGNSYIRLVTVEGRRDLDGVASENDTVVALSNQGHIYASAFKRTNPKLLIWDINGYDCWEGFLVGKPRWIMDSALIRRWRNRLACEIAIRNGIVFVNEVSQSSFKKIAWPMTEVGTIVPVPVPLLDKPRMRALLPDKVIRAVYIGRAEPWKVAPAKWIIRDFLRDNLMRLTIITESAERFRQQLGTGLDKIDFIEGLSGNKLESFLLAEADLCFGMGTACLDGARLGIPSILCDFTLGGSELPANYGYRWLFEERGFTLGHDVRGMANVSNTSSDRMLEQLRSSSLELGHRCWCAVRDKFEVSNVVDKLLKASQETHLTIKQFRDNPAVRLFQTKWGLVKRLRGPHGPEKLLRDVPLPRGILGSALNKF
jgi:hypothetical protein